ncbi:DUF3102 domain-containing protein [uncultured Anaerococcus sp.]|uniref:DUF3102 domain-containing protein n=1 Tax=uncultured Anaerococcus sp. TaxID=293428 RepID=UPI00288A9C86|nr:DUF3102 domain-containing protein [uncultured Anaerococcus sp.]
MGDLANLNQIVSEIKFFENQAVVSYWEIGKRLSQAKEQVGHGEWIPWIEENLNYTRQTASSLIRVYESYPNGNTSLHLNFSKVLALTSIKDEEDRQDFIDSHEVEDMTTRQLQAEIKEYKAGLEEKEKQLEESTAANKRLADKVIELEQREPEIIEKEVVPEDYEDLKEQQKDLLDIQRNLEEELYRERKNVKEVEPKDYKDLKLKAKEIDKLYEEIKRKNIQILSLQNKEKEALEKLEEYDANKKIINDLRDFMWSIDTFIRRVGGLIYLTDYYKELSKEDKKYFDNSVDRIYDWSGQLKENLKQIKNKEK